MTGRADIALGSNLGDRAGQLASARAAISLLPSSRVIAVSAIDETAPFGASAQAPYLNQMLALETGLGPVALLRALQSLEHRLGRVRRERWGARTIDLDLVRYGTVTMRSRALTLPHPGLAHRDFWRRELDELTHLLTPAA